MWGNINLIIPTPFSKWQEVLRTVLPGVGFFWGTSEQALEAYGVFCNIVFGLFTNVQVETRKSRD